MGNKDFFYESIVFGYTYWLKNGWILSKSKKVSASEVWWLIRHSGEQLAPVFSVQSTENLL